MNITQGPMLDRFAAITDVPVAEVVEWVNQYVNHPELAKDPEPTEKERFESIKAYIQRRISASSDEKVRRAIVPALKVAA